MSFKFEKLIIWQKSMELGENIHLLTKDFPKEEMFSLTSQIRRSGNSVSANIAEGFGRRTNKDKCNFYIIARGSAYETQNHLIYGNKVGYFEKEKTKQLYNEYNTLIYELNKIIKALSSQPQPLSQPLS